MKIEPFLLERWQSIWENHVEINLSDSGVHPMTVRELLDDPAAEQALLDQRLVYVQTNGPVSLREIIAARYPGATADHVEVMNGGAEANFIATYTLIEPGDEVVCMVPNYMQIPGIAESMGATVRPWKLTPDLDGDTWRLDLERLEELVNERTKLIAICNPDNPTGACFDADQIDAILRIAERHGAWALFDEIYAGSEREGEPTPTAFGRSERVIVTNSLSKAYGLPGLRLGWTVAPTQLTDDFWTRHDYTTIAPSAQSVQLGELALSEPRLSRILDRARGFLRENFAVVSEWLDQHRDSMRYITPRAGAMLFLKYDLAVNSSDLAQRLMEEKSVLLVPGDHYGMDGWLRIGFGNETDEVRTGLDRLHDLVVSLNK